ncbi:unnamed protein product [Rhizophagus irregularis]|nr:unnamed protein product [Rhizophagus irregularis]
MAKIIGLEARNAKLEDENMKLRTKFRSRIEELEKSRSDIAGENAKRDGAIAELKAEEVNNVPNLSVDHPNNASPLLCEEDRKTDEFLYSVQKKSVSDGIRRRKREEKLQKQDLTSDDRRSLQKKNQREKFIQEVSGTPSDLLQSNADSAEQQQVILSNPCKKADSSSFARLYEKLRNAEDFADHAGKLLSRDEVR